MGTETVARHGSAALNNCGFVTTEDIATLERPSRPFTFLMDMSMLGVGIGFDVKGAGKIEIQEPCDKAFIYTIPDSREGWVESTGLLLDSYLLPKQSAVEFDYSSIREYGAPIKGFGGVASGPEPLKKLHEQIRAIFKDRAGETITVRDIVDIQNMIGCCVVAGNVRRSAEIVMGPATEEYLKLKDYRWNTEKQMMEGSMVERAEYGWASNNSLDAQIGMDYTDVAKQTAVNGEPGYVWLENLRKNGRTIDPPNNKDHRAMGTNPCAEQTLESYELCCLVETFPHRAESKEDYLRTLKFAYLYAKTVTLLQTHDVDTNRVLLRNRRIGTSMSGIAQFIEDKGKAELVDWMDNGYKAIQHWDEIYAEWFCVPQSIKTTSVKPSGTVSLLAGATPGIHYPEDTCYIRRIRISEDSPLLEKAMDNGFHCEPSVSEPGSWVIEFPVKIEGVKPITEVSIWEQVANVDLVQTYWADNHVSNTIKFKKEEADQIKPILDTYQFRVKTLSFLPHLEDGTVFPQMPYEGITEERYDEMVSKIKSFDFSGNSGGDGSDEKYCSNDKCTL